MLITKLFGYGVPTKSRPDENALLLQYKVQIVHRNTERVRSIQPGVLTGLSAAVAVLYNAPTELIILAIGAGADIANSNMVTSGHYEIIITTSMTTDDRYIFRSSDIYYINDKDFFQYQENMPQTNTIMLSSGKSPNSHEKLGLLPRTTDSTTYLDDSAIFYDKTEM